MLLTELPAPLPSPFRGKVKFWQGEATGIESCRICCIAQATVQAAADLPHQSFCEVVKGVFIHLPQ